MIGRSHSDLIYRQRVKVLNHARALARSGVHADHTSIIAHLATVDVQVGQTVERSQPFATVGSTGLSQGPHLHWELWVGGENVDPLEWTERDLP